MAASDAPSGSPPTSRSFAVIGRDAPTDVAAAAGPGGPPQVPIVTVQTFRALYAGEFFGAANPGSSPLPWPSP
jgi:hypothetical protein